MTGSDQRLEVDHLCKHYGDIRALNDMSFEVRSGEMFGFVGGNGSGKTTTMRIALGVLEADSGEVRWGGRRVDLSVWRRIGYMPEERGLYPKMKVGEQLQYLAELHGLTRRTAREAVTSWCERLGVDARMDDELQKLSLGNQQRVQLAAALVHSPDILVLDEPFSGLDPLAVDVMSGVMREQCANGVPVLFSSHQLDLVERLCDRVGIVNKGSMVAIGDVDDLRAKGGTRLVVTVENASRTWNENVSGFVSADVSGNTTTFELEPGNDGQELLRAAAAAGIVREFSFRRSSLTELFRNVVSETAKEQEVTA